MLLAIDKTLSYNEIFICLAWNKHIVLNGEKMVTARFEMSQNDVKIVSRVQTNMCLHLCCLLDFQLSIASVCFLPSFLHMVNRLAWCVSFLRL